MNNNGKNENDAPLTANGRRGAFADGLTLLRVLLTPAVMALIIWDWPNMQPAILASFLFIIAAVTDFFDDVIGGAKTSVHRQFGWFDDIADTLLIVGTLWALLYVLHRAGNLHWLFAVPAAVIIIRELAVGLLKGYDLSKNGWPVTRWISMKNGLTILAVCLLLGAPWITTWIDSFRANDATVMEVYNSASPLVWQAGQIALWLAAVLSAVTGFGILTGRSQADDAGDAA